MEGQGPGRKDRTHSIILCVTSTQGRICTKNVLEKPVVRKTYQVMAKEVSCKMTTKGIHKSGEKEKKPFMLKDLGGLVSLEATTLEKKKLRQLLNEHCDLFAADISELGTVT